MATKIEQAVTAIKTAIDAKANSADVYSQTQVDEKINQFAAHYLTDKVDGQFVPFATHEALYQAKINHSDATPRFWYADEAHTPDKNDYCVVLADETHDGKMTRYAFVGEWGTGSFRYQYTINDTALDEDQWSAINSGITAEKVAKYDAITVPTNVSELNNDAGYLTSHQSLDNYATKDEVNQAIQDNLTEEVDGEITEKFATNEKVDAAIESSHNDSETANKLYNEVIIPKLNDLQQVLDGKEGEMTSHIQSFANNYGSTNRYTRTGVEINPEMFKYLTPEQSHYTVRDAYLTDIQFRAATTGTPSKVNVYAVLIKQKDEKNYFVGKSNNYIYEGTTSAYHKWNFYTQAEEQQFNVDGTPYGLHIEDGYKYFVIYWKMAEYNTSVSTYGEPVSGEEVTIGTAETTPGQRYIPRQGIRQVVYLGATHSEARPCYIHNIGSASETPQMTMWFRQFVTQPTESLNDKVQAAVDSAMTNVYSKTEVDDMIENAGKVKTVNGVEPDESGNIEIEAGGGDAESYKLISGEWDAERKHVVQNCSVTKLVINDAQSYTIELPVATEDESVRDFILRIENYTSSNATVNITPPAGETVNYETAAEDWAVIAPGVNIISFTETKR